MNIKLKVLITVFISLLIIGGGYFYLNNNRALDGKSESKEFIKAISYLRNEDYVNAYNTIKNTNREDINIIQTATLYKFNKYFSKTLDLDIEILEEVNNIMDYLIYPSLYTKTSSYQQRIDKIYDNQYPKYLELKAKFPESIMFKDSLSFYNLFIEFLEINDGMFKNYEYNALNDKTTLQSKLAASKNKSSELTEAYKDILGKHPEEEIPEEYRYLLDI